MSESSEKQNLWGISTGTDWCDYRGCVPWSTLRKVETQVSRQCHSSLRLRPREANQVLRLEAEEGGCPSGKPGRESVLSLPGFLIHSNQEQIREVHCHWKGWLAFLSLPHPIWPSPGPLSDTVKEKWHRVSATLWPAERHAVVYLSTLPTLACFMLLVLLLPPFYRKWNWGSEISHNQWVVGLGFNLWVWVTSEWTRRGKNPQKQKNYSQV